MRVSDSTQDHGPFDLPINSSAEPDHPHDEDDLYDQPQAERDAREATELARLRRNYSRASQRQRGLARSLSRPNGLLKRGLYALNTFWKNQISVVVPHDACRDHLALERTFLGYLRTSLILSMMGVLVSQLFRIQRVPKPDPKFGYFILGKPLACICHGAALGISGMGAFKCWRSQNAIIRGKALVGGFEILFAGVGILLVVVTFFVLLIAVDIKKERL